MDTAMITVNGETMQVKIGTLLSDLGTGQLVGRPCAGRGVCGKCKIRAAGELSPLSGTEKEKLSVDEIKSGVRLACQARVLGPCEVRTIPESGQNVLLGGITRKTDSDPAYENSGIAVDVGTTTIAARLLDKNGEVTAEAGGKNPQSSFGADVVSRMEAALGGRAEVLSEAVLRAIDGICVDLCKKAGKDPLAVDALVITGNTSMLYLLTKTSPEWLSHAPFLMERGFGEETRAKDLGLAALSPEARVYLPPCISAFVGADTVCAILASGMLDSGRAEMLADIGTNGEMALFDGNILRVCSTAAGPAFEGVGISMGMCCEAGAIDRVSLVNGQPFAHVIGGVQPAGICGSGLIDAIACFLDNETIDETGLSDGASLTVSAPVRISDRDVRAVQVAKSAISSGLLSLLHAAKISENDVSALSLAGGFGTSLRIRSAVRIGLLPAGLANKAKSIGNAALAGASMLLLDRKLRDTAEKIASSAETLSLSTDPFFSKKFIEEMLFPEAE